MTKLKLTLFALIVPFILQAQKGSIYNIQASQRNDGTKLVDVYFTLSGDADAYYMTLEVSFNNGNSYFPISGNFLSGDVGPIATGSNLHIIWNGTSTYPNLYSNQTLMKISATPISSLNSCAGTPIVVDIDGNAYNTIQIGTQCWMMENLRTSRYKNGLNIQGDHFVYANDTANKYLYGNLYTHNAVNATHGLCPEGWHVPTSTEWVLLINYPSGAAGGYNGRQLKSCRQVNNAFYSGGNCETEEHPRWNESTQFYGTDDYGFGAMPGGYRDQNGNYYEIGVAGRYWEKEHGSISSTSVRFYLLFNGIYREPMNNSYGISVRCVKDSQ